MQAAMAGATPPVLRDISLLADGVERLSTVHPAFRCRIKADFIKLRGDDGPSQPTPSSAPARRTSC